MYSVLPEDRSQRLGEELQGWAQTSERREEEWEFPCGAKGLGKALPSSGFSWASSPDTARSPPQADPGLSPVWRLGEPVFPVHLWTWREPAAMALEAELCPWRWGPWRSVSALLSCSWPVSPVQSLAGTCFLRLKLLPQGLFLWCFRVCTAHLSGALQAVSQHLWGSQRAPCSEGSSPTPPLPCFPFGEHAALHCALFLIAGTGIRKWRDLRKMHGSLL